jgi:uncharacterized delta-60 repeat protein
MPRLNAILLRSCGWTGVSNPEYSVCVTNGLTRPLLMGILNWLVAFVICGVLHAQSIDSFNPGANDAVLALAIQPDGKVLVGGAFTSLGGANRSYIGRLNPDGSLDSTFNPGAYSSVYCIAVQPDGGILLGGSFSKLGGQTCLHLGRLSSSGQVDPDFRPTVSNAVNCVTIQGDGKIIIGGLFKGITGQVRTYIARLNASGTVDASFNPGAANEVYGLAVQPDGRILSAGRFSNIGGVSGPYLARVLANGSVDGSFYPAPDNYVYSVGLQADGKVLVGGRFTNLGGLPCSRIGRLNSDGSLDTAFASGADGYVYSIVLQTDGKILVGGAFTNLLGQFRPRIGRLNVDGSLDASFNITCTNTVYALAIQPDGKILAGGSFTSAGGLLRSNLARFNNTGPSTQDLRFEAGGLAWSRTGTGAEVWRTTFEASTNGADWFSVGDGTRIANTWSISAPSLPTNATVRVRGLAASGQFTGSSGLVETMIGRPVISPQPTNWVVNAGSDCVLFSGAIGPLPIGFQWLKDGMPLNDGAGVSGVHTNSLGLSSVLGGNGGAYALVATNSYGSTTSRVATVTVIDPVITKQPASLFVHAGQNALLAVSVIGTSPHYQWQKDGQTLAGATDSSLLLTNAQWADRGSYQALVSNAFGSITSTAAVIRVNAAPADAFDPRPDSIVQCFGLQPDNRILVGGNFVTLGATTRKYIARLNPDGSVDATFQPEPTGGTMYYYAPQVLALAQQPDGNILLGGLFTYINGQLRYAIARVTADGGLDPLFDPEASRDVYCLVPQPDGKVLVGGAFFTIAGYSRLHLARLNADGTVDAAFEADAIGNVYALALQPDGRIVVGGNFGELAGRGCQSLGRLNSDGTGDSSFIPGVVAPVGMSPCVYALAIQPDGKILVGGNFIALGGMTCNRFGRIDTHGMLDTNFTASVDGDASSSVFSTALQVDGKIIVGGRFYGLDGEARASIGRLNPDGSLDPMFMPEPTSSWTGDRVVQATALQADGNVLVGGAFTDIGGQTRSNMARLINPSPATQNLMVTGTNILWQRGGSSPEVWRTTFDVTTNGTVWTGIGDGTRVPGGWQLAGVSLPTNSVLRARGLVSGSGSSWFVERTSLFAASPPVILAMDQRSGALTNGFGFGMAGLAGQVVVVEASTNLSEPGWIPLRTNTLSWGEVYLNDLAWTNYPSRFYRLRCP